ncbi:PRC-barrel domain-containing protein [Methanobrevibacter sp. OttesenSCG-928-K11]|nr:PRC-barrel domain-containing protein [Methanobrevibacter sp. OttesenSCG-928-K11]MDL2270857.1 PRC-barrel domain-containing protein [Methanobrevibacter sp. OttesenSCG-928-I08]
MVEVSNLYNLDIYTIAGQYVGRVADVVLNIRLGTISKLQVKAIEMDKKQVGIRDIWKRGFQFVPEEEGVRNYKDDLLTIDFDKVQAIGDIMLIDPRDIQKAHPPQAPQAPQAPQVPQNMENFTPKKPVNPEIPNTPKQE